MIGRSALLLALLAGPTLAEGGPTEAEREAFIARERAIYEEDVDLLRLASELVIDAIVDFGDLRVEIIRRLERARTKDRHFSDRRHGVPPV